MKSIIKISFFSCWLSFLILLTVFSQNDDNSRDKPWMKVIKIGDSKIVVPKGTKIKREGGSVILENINEYVARKMYKMEQQLSQIRKSNQELKNKIKTLQEKIEALGINLKPSPDE